MKTYHAMPATAISAARQDAPTALIAVVGNDYPEESSRGKMIGFGNAMNGVGVLFIALGIAQIPAILMKGGTDPVTAGRVMFLVAASLCFLSAIRLIIPTSCPVLARASADVNPASAAAASAHSEMNMPLIETSARPMNAAP